MRIINTKLIYLLLGILFIGCTNDFTEINSNSRTVYEVDPASFLYQTQAQTRSSSWEWYYDYYLAQMRWMQYGVRPLGNLSTVYTFSNPSMLEQRYRLCWLNTGSYMKHLEYYVNTNFPDEAERYSNMIEAARVTLIYQGIITSDSHGSLAYTEGWNLRSGKTNTEPNFDTQESLFDLWDSELKIAANKFKTNTNQVSFNAHDVAYYGDVKKWIKAANALRLRIAIRLLNRNPVKAKSIATEVLADNANLPANNSDGFIFWLEGRVTEHGDYSSVADLIRASKGFMDYLNKYNDPRRRMFYRINNLTPENITAYNATAEGKASPIPANTGRWIGGSADPDQVKPNSDLFMARTLSTDSEDIDMRLINRPQTRIFSGFYDKGDGGTWFPNLTYPDFCFMAAEFALMGIPSNKTAEQWYTDGVGASVDLWNLVGEFCKIHDYSPITPQEKADFLNQPDIKWNAAKGLEQIYVQSYVEHFKNSNEGWSLWKRTGYPSYNSDILALEKVYVETVEQKMPRRYRFAYPMDGTPNYLNMRNRLDVMKEDPNFGELTNEFGRIWWDAK